MRTAKKTLSLLLTLAMVITMIPAITLTLTEQAHAYSTYTKNYSTEWYYASGTTFIHSMVSGYDGSKLSTVQSQMREAGYTPFDLDTAQGVKSAVYSTLGYKTTTDPTKAITGMMLTGRGNIDETPKTSNYYPNTGTAASGTAVSGVVFYEVNRKITSSGGIDYEPAYRDGHNDMLADGKSCGYKYFYVTRSRSAGPPVTTVGIYGSVQSGMYATRSFDNIGAAQDTTNGAGTARYVCFKSTCTTVNSDTLRTNYTNALNTYNSITASNYTTASYNALKNALDTGSAILSDLNDGYTTSNQTTINNAATALANARSGLQTNLYLKASTNGGASDQTVAVTVGTGTTGSVNFGSYSASKSGWNFLGWNASFSATTGSKTTATVGFNNTYYAIYSKVLTGTFHYLNASAARTSSAPTVTIYNTATSGAVAPPSLVSAKYNDVTYSALGWRTDNTAAAQTVAATGNKTISADTTYRAVYSGMLTLSYDLAGGSGTFNNQTATQYLNAGSSSLAASTASVTINTTTPTRNGYTFAGWTPTNGTLSNGTFTFNNGKNGKLTATWTATPYSISFNANGGNAVSALDYKITDTTTLPSTTRDGYTFNNWKVTTAAGGWTANATFNAGTSVNGKYGSPTLTAQWTPYTYQVHFNGNGATSGSMENQDFTYDVAQHLSANVFKKEYTVNFDHKGGSGDTSATAAAGFDGWAISAGGDRIYRDQEEAGNLTAVNNGTANLFAKWKAMGSVTLPTSSKEGCTFDGWYSDAELTSKVGNAGAAYTPAENGVTLYAKHTTNTYTITFKGENDAVLDTQTVEHGATPQAPAIPAKAPNAAQHFTGAWNTPVVPATADATYTVVYTGEDHTGGEATCVAQAVCGVCGTSYGELNTTNHKHTHTDDAVTANCITEGFTAGIFCDDCDQYVSGHVSQGYDFTENGHSYGSWESNGNDTHTKTCSRCAAETENHTVTADCHGGTATCLAPAVCDDCGEAYGGYGAHDLSKVPAQAPTCLAPGHVGYWHCSVCNKNFIDNTGATEITAYQNGHTPAEAVKENDVPSTCSTLGSYDSVVYCEVCRAEISRTPMNYNALDPANHEGETETKEENIVAGTCAAERTWDEVVYCKSCNEQISSTPKTGEKDMNNHVGGTEIRGKVTATCTVEGYSGDTWCLGCGKKIADGESTGYANHQLTFTAEKEATCKETGFVEYWYCDDCGQYFLTEDAATPLTAEELAVQGVIGKTNEHTPGAAKEENRVDATCTAEGSYDEVVRCTVCNEVISTVHKTIDKLAHTPGEAVKENEAAATCTTDGGYDLVIRCTVCGNEISREPHVVPAGHTAGEVVKENETAPTCTDAGSYDAVVYCAECGEEMSRDTVTVPAKGHTWGEWEVVTPATEEADGEAKRVCSVCGAEETKPISAMGDEITKTIKFVNIAKMHYELDLGDGETYEIYNSSTVQWISRQALRFKVVTYASYNYDDIIIRANGTEITPDADGYYSLPKTAETVIVTAEGAVKDDSAPGGKLSFWELLIRFFRKIVAFFSSAFGKK